MRIPVLVTLIASLVLASCGFRDSRLNPRNWFGGGREVQTTETAPTNPLLPRRNRIARRPDRIEGVAIGQVTELRIEPTPTGAIIYAAGIADRQGAYRAELVPDNPGLEPVDGVLSFSFNVLYPRYRTPVGSDHTRTVHEAFSISSQNLRDVSVIRVNAARNAQESRRRRR